MLCLKKLIVYLLAGMVSVAMCACSGGDDGIILIGSEEQTEWSESIREEAISEVPVEDDTPETIRVYVCGAVNNPGVVEIPMDSRVENALEAAGGFAESADSTYVNLAAWVMDGQMLYFPTEEEASGGHGDGTYAQGGVADSDMCTDGLVNINTADAALLCTLPGIGESRAADIIAYREANGFFETCEEIMCVPGIKNGLFEKIRNKITVK